MDEAVGLIKENGPASYVLAVSGNELGDAPNGEAVRLITEFQIPTIVFTATYDDETRDQAMKIAGVVDYVTKESKATVQYLCNMIHRLIENRNIKAMVVDDSRTVRLHVGELLRKYQFQVLEAKNGQEALEVLANNRDIKLIVTDYHMEPIDGFELTKQVRETYGKNELAIIGLSSSNVGTLSARFIKTGANDFLAKNFLPEEFFCRVTQNIDLIEKTAALADAATKDFLTGLYNRRFFYERGVGKLDRARGTKSSVALAMLDIDHFKSVNDTFGHDVGDEVLRVISKILQDTSRPDDLVARLGGEEFCVLLDDITQSELVELFENMRATIEAHHFESLQERKFVTASFGVVIAKDESLDQLVANADALLYEAKESGRNKVTFES
ncbi:MAG: diguanylate cyclase [Rhodospirillales bacterium]|nr:diguanylate cyclase [Rhodospirillales bacterium]